MNTLTATKGQINTDFGKKAEEIIDGTALAELIKSIRDTLPYVLDGLDGSSRYILVAEVREELEEWVSTGKTEKHEFKALPDDKEREFEAMCERHGYTVTSGRQKMSYMNHDADIVYLRARDPETKVSVALIPWFINPRKKYPVFAYLYAEMYRCQHKAGVRESARAAAELFGVGIHYSTVSRGKGTAQALIAAKEEMPVVTKPPVSLGDAIASVPAILSKAAEGSVGRDKSDRPAPSACSQKRKQKSGCPATGRTGGATNTKYVGRQPGTQRRREAFYRIVPALRAERRNAIPQIPSLKNIKTFFTCNAARDYPARDPKTGTACKAQWLGGNRRPAPACGYIM